MIFGKFGKIWINNNAFEPFLFYLYIIARLQKVLFKSYYMVVLHYIFRLDHVFCLSNNLPIIQLPPSTQYLSYLQSKCMYVHEYNMNYYCNHFLSYLKSYIVCNYLTLVLFTLQPSRRQHEDSNRFVPSLLWGQRHSGADYLVFVSSCSLKTREKYTN